MTDVRRQQLRLLLLSHVPDDPDGGASRVYHLLASALRARGHHVDLYHLEDMGLPARPRLRLLARRLAMPQLLSRFANGLDLTSYDVVMASSGMAYPLHERLRELPRRPLRVNHVHGLTVYDHLAALAEARLGHHRSGPANRLLTGPFQMRWDEAGVRAADVTVVQNLRDLGAVRSLRSGATTMIPAAVHPELVRASHDAPPVGSRPAGSIVWFGTWEARKGAFYVPAAFRALRQQRPDATLTIGGTGQAPQQVLAAFAPEDRTSVTVLGRISVSEHAALLGSSSVFLFPSLSEGFGLALPEAMCFGCAAVTTATAFGADFLTDGVDARLVAASSEHIARALVDLVGDDGARRRIAAAGQVLARGFTADRMVDAYEDLFLRSVPARVEPRAVSPA